MAPALINPPVSELQKIIDQAVGQALVNQSATVMTASQGLQTPVVSQTSASARPQNEKAKNLKPYNPKRESWDVYLCHLEQIREFNGWDDAMTLHHLTASLEGEPLKFYQSLRTQNPSGVATLSL